VHHTVVGQFESPAAAVRGIETLRAHGFEIDQVRDATSVLVSVHVKKARVDEARVALLAAGAVSVSVDAPAS
jgi:hypothetical protein